ncbi:MAG: hypothetical protein HY702_04090 [Gemmatimonadetes bacterium]|nr:hypothetical protein [Gemmatimonadota bacterium]
MKRGSHSRCRGRGVHLLAVGTAALWGLAWLGCARDRDLRSLPRLTPLPDAGATAWAGLLHPSAIRTDSGGRVYVADIADRSVKVFDAFGTPITTLGGTGRGPGEFQRIQDFEVIAGEVIVLDSGLRRVVRMTEDGSVLGSWPTEGEEVLASLGADVLILANSPEWSLVPPDGRTRPPLLRVLDLQGETRYRLGERQPSKTPFADYVANFVLPAGTPDGRRIWLARLNDPVVEVFSSETRASRWIGRHVPFDWRRIAPDFVPSQAMLTPAGRAAIPFDPVSLDIATDALGRAYILTALTPDRNEGRPRRVGVDILDPRDGKVTRYVAPEPATHIAVSPDGGILYLVDEREARVRLYAHRREGSGDRR